MIHEMIADALLSVFGPTGAKIVLAIMALAVLTTLVRGGK